MAVIKHLFEPISKQDSEVMRIFFAWIQNSSVEELQSAVPS
jgi:hypothetical protein